MALIESLKVLITADSSGLENGFARAESRVKKMAEDMDRLSSTAALAGGAMTAFGAVMVRNAAQYDASVKTSVDGLSNAYNHLSVQVGQMLLPVIDGLAAALSAVVGWVEQLSPETKELAVHVAAVAAGFLALGSAAKVTSIFLRLLPILLPIAGTLIGVVAAIGGIIAITGLLRQAWDSNWNGMRDKVRAVIDFVVNGFNSFVGGLKSIFMPVADFIVKALLEPLRSVLEGIHKIASAIPGIPEGIRGGIEAALDTIKDIQHRGFGGLVDDATEGFRVMWGVVEKVGREVAEGTKKNWHDIIEKIKQEFKTAIELPSLRKLEETKPGTTAGGGGPRATATATATATASVSNTVGAMDQLAQAFGKMGQAIQAIVSGNPLVALLMLAAENESFIRAVEILNKLFSILAPVLDAVTRPLLDIIATITNIMAPLVPVIALFLQLMQMFFQPILMIVRTVLPVFLPVIKALGIGLLFLSKGIAIVLNAVIGLVQSILGWVANFEIAGVRPFSFLDGIIQNLETLKDRTDYDAKIRDLESIQFGAPAAAIDDNTKAVDVSTAAFESNTKAVGDFVGSLTNVPQGFKVALARYRAASPVPGLDLRGQRESQVNVFLNGRLLAKEMSSEMARIAFEQVGSLPPVI